MIGLGVVLLVVAETGRYGWAGALSATFALVNAAAAPAIARLVDRLGQRRVLLRAVPLHLVALVAFVVVASRDAPTWAQVVTIVVAALAAPSIGSLVRARWGFVLGEDPRLGTAYALESVLDELIFVLGPLIVTLLATLVAPQLGLLTAGVLLATGTGLLVSHRASEPPPSPHADDHPSALRSVGLPPLMAVMVFVGGVFGAVEISAVAFADEAGHRGTGRAAAGLLRRRQHAVGDRLRVAARDAAAAPLAAARRRDDDRDGGGAAVRVVDLAAGRSCWCWPAWASRRR